MQMQYPGGSETGPGHTWSGAGFNLATNNGEKLDYMCVGCMLSWFVYCRGGFSIYICQITGLVGSWDMNQDKGYEPRPRWCRLFTIISLKLSSANSGFQSAVVAVKNCGQFSGYIVFIQQM